MVRRPSLRMAAARWVSTVLRLTPSLAPALLLVLPSAISCTTARSRGVRMSRGRAWRRVEQRVEQVRRDLAGDVGLVPAQRLHGGDQVVVGVGLEQVAPRARRQDVLHDGLAVVHGEDQNLGARRARPDRPRRLDAVLDRQRLLTLRPGITSRLSSHLSGLAPLGTEQCIQKQLG